MNTLKSDICFRNINLTGAFLALAAQNSGLKVTIVLPSTLNWDYEPEITPYYPISFNQFWNSYTNIRFIENISSLFPNLVYPVRIFTFNSTKKINAKTIEAFDFLLKREMDHASLPLNPSDYEVFKPFEENLHAGALSFEYLFDRNKAIIDLLVACKQKGARVISEDDYEKSTTIQSNSVLCQQFNKEENRVIIKNYHLNFKNDLRLITDKVEIQIQKLGDDTLLKFNMLKKIDLQEFTNQCCSQLTNIGFKDTDNFRPKLKSIYGSLTECNTLFNKDKNIINDININNLAKYYFGIEKRISKQIGKKILLKKTLNPVKQNTISADKFRQIQNTCDEKFDLAKQTGVPYLKFKYFFYRYPEKIDDFIEIAYEQMNQTRDAELIWDNIEKEYQIFLMKDLLS